MIQLYPVSVSSPVPCPYIEGREASFEFFYAAELSAQEMDGYISTGWRCFGLQHFRPVCDCRECVSMRIPVADFVPSKSQRRILRKNADVELAIGPLRYSDAIFGIYKEHSLSRFKKEPGTEREFIEQFYTPSCPGAQSEFRIEGKLVGTGFLNISEKGLSSVYFVYRDGLLDRSFGIFSMLAEIEFARKEGFSFYYPGYWIRGNPRMNYKGTLRPKQIYHPDRGVWLPDQDLTVDNTPE